MEKDQGFVLKKTRYSESSTILHIFTAESGMLSFYYPGGQKKNQALLSPLAEISFQYRKKNEDQMPMLIKPEEEQLWKNIYFDPIKSCQMYFMNEVLHNTIPEKDPDPKLYQFIKQGLQLFESSKKSANFHLYFLSQLTRFLGFYPETGTQPNYFDLYNGLFSTHSPKSQLYEEGPVCKKLQDFFTSEFQEQQGIELSGKQRIALADLLVKYFQTQLDGFYPPKSLEVLSTVFS